MSEQKEEILNVIKKLIQIRPDDPTWKNIIDFLVVISKDMSNEQLYVLTIVLDDLKNPYVVASLIIMMMGNIGIQDFNLLDRFTKNSTATTQEMDFVMEQFKILEIPERTLKYAIFLTVHYELGPHGRAAAIISSIV